MATRNTSHSGFHATALAAVNDALVVLGQDVLLDELSLTSKTVNSRKAACLYDASRLKVLRDHNWNFARTEQPCDGCGCTGGGGGLPFLAAVPPRCVRVLDCFGCGGRCEYRLYGREIRSDRPVDRIVYTQDVEDLDRWTPDAYRALVLRLAADLAKPVTGRVNERQLQESAYDEQLQAAKLADSRESNVPYDAWGDNHYVKAMRGEARAANPGWRR